MSFDTQHAVGERVENQLELIILSYVIKDVKYIQKIIDFGAKADWFTSESLRVFYEMALNYFNKHNSIITKNFWVQKISTFSLPDPSVRAFYEQFYDNLRAYDYGHNDLSEHLEQWRVSVGKYKVSQSVKEYASALDSYGFDKAIELLSRNISVAKGSEDRGKQYYISDLETDGCEMVLQDAVNRKENPDGTRGFPTGYKELDLKFNGFERGKVAMIMGLTSSGKTTFARNIAWNIKNLLGVRVLIISCEESRLDYLKKVACAELKLSLKQFLRGQLSDEDMQKLRDWVANFKRVKAEMEEGNTDKSWYKVLEVPARKYNLNEIDAIIEKEFPLGVDVVVLDQLSLVAPVVDRGENTRTEMGDSTKVYREMSKRRNFAGILLAQAGRSAVKKHKGERWVELNFEDVEGSNQPMQDMDSAFGIRRDLQISEITWIKLLKQREGEVNFEIRLRFDADKCRFEDIDEDSFGFGAAEKPPRPGTSRSKVENLVGPLPYGQVQHPITKEAIPMATSAYIPTPKPLITPSVPQNRPMDFSEITGILQMDGQI